MINKFIILEGVITSGINGFCLLLFLFSINKITTIRQTELTIILLSLTCQFVFSIIYLILYKKLEKDYRILYFLNFLLNILTSTLYCYSIVTNNETGIFLLIYINYSILTLYLIVNFVRKIFKKSGYKIIKPINGKECCICCEEIIKECVELTCKHIYHKQCIDKWFLNNTTCPYCRYEVL